MWFHLVMNVDVVVNPVANFPASVTCLRKLSEKYSPVEVYQDFSENLQYLVMYYAGGRT